MQFFICEQLQLVSYKKQSRRFPMPKVKRSRYEISVLFHMFPELLQAAGIIIVESENVQQKINISVYLFTLKCRSVGQKSPWQLSLSFMLFTITIPLSLNNVLLQDLCGKFTAVFLSITPNSYLMEVFGESERNIYFSLILLSEQYFISHVRFYYPPLDQIFCDLSASLRYFLERSRIFG